MIAALLIPMLNMSPAPTSATQKLMNLVNKFGKGDCSKNEVRRICVLTKGPTRADYVSSNYVSHAVSNFVRNSAKKSAITQPQTLKRLLTNYVKPLLKNLSFNTSIRNNTSGLKLTRLGMLLVKCWVSWLMIWANAIWWPTSCVKRFLLKHDTKLTTVSFCHCWGL